MASECEEFRDAGEVLDHPRVCGLSCRTGCEGFAFLLLGGVGGRQEGVCNVTPLLDGLADDARGETRDLSGGLRDGVGDEFGGVSVSLRDDAGGEVGHPFAGLGDDDAGVGARVIFPSFVDEGSGGETGGVCTDLAYDSGVEDGEAIEAVCRHGVVSIVGRWTLSEVT